MSPDKNKLKQNQVNKSYNQIKRLQKMLPINCLDTTKKDRRSLKKKILKGNSYLTSKPYITIPDNCGLLLESKHLDPPFSHTKKYLHRYFFFKISKFFSGK